MITIDKWFALISGEHQANLLLHHYPAGLPGFTRLCQVNCRRISLSVLHYLFNSFTQVVDKVFRSAGT